MSPHSTTRACIAMRRSTVSSRRPPTLSKKMSTPCGRELLQPAGDVFGLVVDARVEAELVDDPCALLRRTRDPDHAGALHLARSDRRSSRRRSRPPTPGTSRPAAGFATSSTPTYAVIPMWPSTPSTSVSSTSFGQHRDRRERVRLHDAVLLPAGQVHERPAQRILVRVVGLDDHADAVGADALADRHAGHVVAALVEPAADRRVDAEVPHLEQRLALTERGDVGLGGFEAVGGDHAVGPAGEHDLTIPACRRRSRTRGRYPCRRPVLAWLARDRTRSASTSTSSRPSGCPTRWTPTSPRSTVLDRHSGTTGRAHLALDRATRVVPATVFVKLAPFDERQRKFVNVQGMGVAEARLYRDLAHELPVRVPRVWYSRVRGHRQRPRRPLRDGARRPRRVGLPLPGTRRRRHRGAHHRHRRAARPAARAVLGEPALRAATATSPGSRPAARPAATAARRWCRWRSTTSPTASPTASCRSPRPTSSAPTTCCALYREGECTLVHGDPHLGNLFVDGDDPTRTGFLDWAVVSRAPGVRDVAYVLSASTPTDLRRAQGDASCSRATARSSPSTA